MKKRNLLLINKLQKGVLRPFPSNFDLPPSVTVGEHETQFFKTERVKTISGEQCPVYVERNINFNLDEVCDPQVPDEEPETTTLPKSSSERLRNLRNILQYQIEWYLEYTKKEATGEVDSSYVYDQMSEVFQDNLTRGDLANIIKELIDE